jgi:hypothetical protein
MAQKKRRYNKIKTPHVTRCDDSNFRRLGVRLVAHTRPRLARATNIRADGRLLRQQNVIRSRIEPAILCTANCYWFSASECRLQK